MTHPDLEALRTAAQSLVEAIDEALAAENVAATHQAVAVLRPLGVEVVQRMTSVVRRWL